MKLAQQGAGVGQLENTMKPSQTVVLIVLSSFALLVTSACNKSPADNSAKMSKPPEPIVVTSTPAVRPEADRKIILAAAERFENLTEAAFSGAQATTGALALAHRESEAAKAVLDPNEAATIAEKLAKIDAAVKSGVAADTALASMEAYRTLIMASNGEGNIPVQVGLLDYAGFRYWANAKASPPRWDEIAAAQFFAQGQWALVMHKISDPALVKKFNEALEAMDKAILAKDSQAAVVAATNEMDLVDELEKQFV